MAQDFSSIHWLRKSINKWVNANRKEGNIVEFFGAFYVVNPENDFKIEEEAAIAFGFKQSLRKTVGAFKDELEKEKEEFINW